MNGNSRYPEQSRPGQGLEEHDSAQDGSGPEQTATTGIRLQGWIAPAVIAIACIAMLIWTWDKWADVFVDFGRELYVPWQITRGRVLYRDLAYLNGPFSPYFNALCFSLLGVSLRTLVICNVFLIGVLLVVLYRLLSEIGSRLSASAACVVFALLFGFGTQRITGNYNNVCPYSHELTHGIILGLASIRFLVLFGRNRKRAFLAGSGFLVGLAFLTKPETLIASASASIMGLILILYTEQAHPLRYVRMLGIFLASAILPICSAFALLCASLSAREALHGVLGAWPATLAGIGTRTEFYRRQSSSAGAAGSREGE